MEVSLHSRSRFCPVGLPFLQRFLVPCPEGRQPEVLRAAWQAFEPVDEATKLVSMPSVVWIHFGEGYVQWGCDGHTLDRLQDREVAFRLDGGQEEPLHDPLYRELIDPAWDWHSQAAVGASFCRRQKGLEVRRTQCPLWGRELEFRCPAAIPTVRSNLDWDADSLEDLDQRNRRGFQEEDR